MMSPVEGAAAEPSPPPTTATEAFAHGLKPQSKPDENKEVGECRSSFHSSSIPVLTRASHCGRKGDSCRAGGRPLTATR